MPILLNGGENPAEVIYNGTPLDEVVFNGVSVWRSASSVIPEFPASIELATIATSDGKTTYVRNAVLDSIVLPGSGDGGKWSAEYACECTFEVAWTRYGICALYLQNFSSGTAHDMSLPDIDNDSTVRVSGVSGVPSGYAFDSLTGMGATATFWLPATQEQMRAVSGSHDTSGVAYGTRACAFDLYSTHLSAKVTQGATEYALNYYTAGLVYQGAATLTIRQA